MNDQTLAYIAQLIVHHNCKGPECGCYPLKKLPGVEEAIRREARNSANGESDPDLASA